jgi:hypothetical protein
LFLFAGGARKGAISSIAHSPLLKGFKMQKLFNKFMTLPKQESGSPLLLGSLQPFFHQRIIPKNRATAILLAN